MDAGQSRSRGEAGGGRWNLGTCLCGGAEVLRGFCVAASEELSGQAAMLREPAARFRLRNG